MATRTEPAELAGLVSQVASRVQAFDAETGETADWSSANLYGGRAGALAFLAEYARLHDEPAMLDDVAERLLDGTAGLAQRHAGTYGLIRGPAAALYALSFVAGAEPSAAERLRSRADELVRALPGPGSAPPLDALKGLPGDVIALSGYARQRPGGAWREPLLARIEAIRRHVATLDGADAPTGLSHGLAGTALALTRAAELLPDSGADEAAAACCRLESEQYDAARGGWPRRDLGGRIDNAWCHGATGIGLSRCAVLARAPGDAVAEADLERALLAVVSSPSAAIDQPCCGTLGRVELLLGAGGLLGLPELVDLGARTARAVVDRAAVSGGFRNGRTRKADGPQLFQGVSGIAYQLLRVADPERTRSFLMFE